MAILIDTPRWPAHGTVFGHLVSDHSLSELHGFARRNALPIQAFDHDHYDVAVRHFDRLVAAGALHLDSRILVTRLNHAGLRVRRHQRLPRPASLVPALRKAWANMLPTETDADRWASVGDDLLAAWSSPSRHYHDPRHLWTMLAALDRLDSSTPELRLATWFHDAVYAGLPGDDEERSAQWAERALPGLVPDEMVAEVARLVRLTLTHQPTPDDPAGQALSDADLSTLAGPEAIYWMYARAIRLEYSHVDDASFRVGRARVLRGFLESAHLFHSERGRELWEREARANLTRELAVWEQD